MSKVHKCDRCGRLPLDTVWYLQINPEPTLSIDFCFDCYTELEVFIEEKGSKVIQKHKTYTKQCKERYA